MWFVYIIGFFLLCFLLIALLLCLLCLSCCKAIIPASSIINFVYSLHLSSFDKAYPPAKCFLCLERVNLEVVTTCNHSYCAQCIVDYIKSKPNEQLNCPACRQKICVLLRKFDYSLNAQSEELRKAINTYNRQYSTEPSFFRSLKEFGGIVGHLPILLSRSGINFLIGNVRIRNIAMLLAYLISPVDLLPEILLGPIGLLDDGAAAMAIVSQLTNLLVDYARQEAERPLDD